MSVGHPQIMDGVVSSISTTTTKSFTTSMEHVNKVGVIQAAIAAGSIRFSLKVVTYWWWLAISEGVTRETNIPKSPFNELALELL